MVENVGRTVRWAVAIQLLLLVRFFYLFDSQAVIKWSGSLGAYKATRVRSGYDDDDGVWEPATVACAKGSWLADVTDFRVGDGKVQVPR